MTSHGAQPMLHPGVRQYIELSISALSPSSLAKSGGRLARLATLHLRNVLPLLALSACGMAAVGEPTTVIRAAGFFPPVANIQVDLKGVDRDATLFDLTAAALRRIGAASADANRLIPSQAQSVNVDVTAPGRDGRPLHFVHLTYDVATLRSAVASGAHGQTLLARARVAGSWSPDNADVIDPWCQGAPGHPLCA